MKKKAILRTAWANLREILWGVLCGSFAAAAFPVALTWLEQLWSAALQRAATRAPNYRAPIRRREWGRLGSWRNIADC